MRLAFTVAGVLLLLLTMTVAAGAWWFTKPMRFAGIERDPAQVKSSAPLPEAERPGITRREIIDLLRTDSFDALTRIVETRNQRALLDPKEEWELGRVQDAFYTSDGELSPHFEAWVVAKPGSFAPLLAGAEHRFALAYASRGKDVASNTSAEQFAGMADQLRLLLQDVAAATHIEPRLSEGYRLLVDTARMATGQRDCGLAAAAGLTVMPASYRVRSALAMCRMPRWGGSHDRVQQVADMAAPFVQDNPRLASLQGFVEWDKGRSSEGDEEFGHYATALTAGPAMPFFDARARAFIDDKHYREALDDIDAALELSPDDPDLLVLRLHALHGLERRDELDPIIDLIAAIDPLNSALAEFRERAVKVEAYEQDKARYDAQSSGSIDQLNAELVRNPRNADTYYFRGRAYLKAGDEARALDDFEQAMHYSSTHFESMRNIDFILARRGEWNAIAERWTEYLSHKPDDGKAYWERAGTYHQAGDEAKSQDDVKKACDLGVAQACAHIKP